MPVMTETENEPPASHRLGMEEEFKTSPIAQLMREYSLVLIVSQLGPMEMHIRLVLNLEELTPDLVMDRGEDRNWNLPRYHLEKATMDNFTAVVAVQKVFSQRAAALSLGRKSYFIVDPGAHLCQSCKVPLVCHNCTLHRGLLSQGSN